MGQNPVLPWFSSQKQMQFKIVYPSQINCWFEGSGEARLYAPFNQNHEKIEIIRWLFLLKLVIQQKYCVNKQISHHKTRFYNDWSRHWHERISSLLDLIELLPLILKHTIFGPSQSFLWRMWTKMKHISSKIPCRRTKHPWPMALGRGRRQPLGSGGGGRGGPQPSPMMRLSRGLVVGFQENGFTMLSTD